MKSVTRIFLRGLATIVPIIITFYVCWWFVSSSESLIEKALTFFLPEEYYVPGMGIALMLLLTLLVGFIMKVTVLSALFDLFEGMIMSFPLVKTIYGGVKDFFDFFSKDQKESFSKAVLVRFGESQEAVLGFVTSKTPQEALGDEVDGCVAVYLPMSYQIGGYTVFVPKESIREAEITVSESLRYILTAGVSKGKS